MNRNILSSFDVVDKQLRTEAHEAYALAEEKTSQDLIEESYKYYNQSGEKLNQVHSKTIDDWVDLSKYFRSIADCSMSIAYNKLHSGEDPSSWLSTTQSALTKAINCHLNGLYPALNYNQTHPDPKDEAMLAQMYDELGYCYHAQGRHYDALQTYQQAISKFESVVNKVPMCHEAYQHSLNAVGQLEKKLNIESRQQPSVIAGMFFRSPANNRPTTQPSPTEDNIAAQTMRPKFG